MNEVIVTGRKLQISESTRRRNPHMFTPVVKKSFTTEPNEKHTDSQSVDRLGSSKPKRQDEERALDGHAPGQSSRRTGPASLHILIVRYGRRKMDSDNLAFAYKHLRDAIASELSIDDGDERIEWRYEQIIGCKIQGTHVLVQQKTACRI